MKKYIKSSLSAAFSAFCLLVIFFTAARVATADAITVYTPIVDISSAPGWATFTGTYDPADQQVTAYFEYKKSGAAAYTPTRKNPASDGRFEATIGFTTAPGSYLFHSVVIGADGAPVASEGGDTAFTIAGSQTTTNGATDTSSSLGSASNNGSQSDLGSVSNNGTGLGSASNTNTNSLTNPLAGVNTIPDFVAKLLNIMLKIAVPILVCAFIYCGFLFVKAQGKEKELEHAKSALLYTVIGAAVVLGAWTLANAISGTINQLK